MQKGKILKDLENDGISIIENFLDEKEVNSIMYTFHNIALKKEDEFYRNTYTEGLGGDERIFFFERYYDKFKNNKEIKDILSEYYGRELDSIFTLVNKLEYNTNEIRNSGGNWHRDSHDKQVKAIVYLTDVKSDTAPFTFIKKSSKKYLGDYHIKNRRFTDEEIDELIKTKGLKKEEICGKAGTLILVDTSNIHRGKPIERYCRMAMFNYYHWGKNYVENFKKNL